MDIRPGVILSGIALALAAPVAAQVPEDDNFTDLASVHLQTAQSTGDDAEAEEAYRLALQALRDGMMENPENPKIYLYAGIAQLGLDDYAQADSMFDRAEEIYPDYPGEEQGTDLYRENGWIEAYNTGLEALQEGLTQEARQAFENAVLIYNKRPEAFLNLANVQANTGDYPPAIENYQLAVEVIEEAEAEGHHQEEMAQWLSYRQTARINMAQIMLMNEQAEEAAEVYEAVLEEDPENTDARSGLAMAMAQTGAGGEAAGIYEEIIDNPESSPIDLYNAGVGMYQAQNFEGAVRAFKTALDRSPMFRDALQNLVQSLAQGAQENPEMWEQMPEFSSKLLEMDPYNQLAYRLHGIALARTGSSDEAVALSEEMEALPFTTQQLQLRTGQGVVGALLNHTLEPGTEVTLRFTFYDVQGDELGTADAVVQAPAQGEAAVLQAPFDDQKVAGYTYDRIE